MKIKARESVYNTYNYDSHWREISKTSPALYRLLNAIDCLHNNYSIMPVTQTQWLVGKNTKNYTVEYREGSFTCTCPDWKFRSEKYLICKHIWMVLLNCEVPDSFSAFLIAVPELTKYIQITK